MVERELGLTTSPALIGLCPAITALRADIAMAARTQAKVLLVGEPGVGKHLVSRLIHFGGLRRDRRFVALNCSGVPETLLESELFGHVKGSFAGACRDKAGLLRTAAGGTLLLDGLGEMSPRLQGLLLRFTETGDVQPVGADRPRGRSDARLLTATHRDLRARIDAGAFGEDLYYRLNVIQLHIPPLRDRGGDVRILLYHFLAQTAEVQRRPVPALPAKTEARLLAYEWPGNVPELKDVAERLVINGGGTPLIFDGVPGGRRGRMSRGN
jgi:transcriptional regulator with GAF, ATPase, and Fis domain